MPEPVASNTNPQPSFTSSTYRTIVAKAPLNLTSDRPLTAQPAVQAFLNTLSEEPVPESLLYRLLTVVELALMQKFPERQLCGLCLGYTLELADIESDNLDDLTELFYVSWGWHSTYAELIETRTEIAETGDSSERELLPLSSEMEKIDHEFSVLKDWAEAELNRYANKDLLRNKHLCTFLFGHFNNNLYRSGQPGHFNNDLYRFGQTTSNPVHEQPNIKFMYPTFAGQLPCNCRKLNDPSTYRNTVDPNVCAEKCSPG